MRPSIDQYFMNMAFAAASRSTCLDKQVGCVLVDKSNYVVSTGYNGPASGEEHCSTCNKDTTGICPAIHAEMNALGWEHVINGTVYCTLEPCGACFHNLYTFGVRRVVFAHKSRKAPSVIPGEVSWEHRPDLMPWPEKLREYHKRLGRPFLNSSEEHKFTQLRELSLALFMEIAEFTESFQWKPWREARTIDTDNSLEELSDILVFTDSILMLLGKSWPDLFERLDRKIQEINERIDNGYHGNGIPKGTKS